MGYSYLPVPKKFKSWPSLDKTSLMKRRAINIPNIPKHVKDMYVRGTGTLNRDTLDMGRAARPRARMENRLRFTKIELTSQSRISLLHT